MNKNKDFSEYDKTDLALLFNQPEEITIVWSVDDIKKVAPNLQDFQARFILSQLKKCHNAELGINWDVIRYTVTVYFPSATMIS